MATASARGRRSPRPPDRQPTAASTANGASNDEHPQYIGRNLRHARLVAGLTLRELSERVGCSESLLSKIENERAVPSLLQMLHRVVKSLDTSIGLLFTDPAATSRIVMRAGERPMLKTSHPQRRGDDVGVHICGSCRIPRASCCRVPSTRSSPAARARAPSRTRAKKSATC